MKIWRIVVLGLLGLAGAGCQNDPTIAMLERDNRKKEWEIIQLRGRVQDLEEAVAAGEPARRPSPRRNAAGAGHDRGPRFDPSRSPGKRRLSGRYFA